MNFDRHDWLQVAGAIALGAWCALLLAWLLVEALGR